MGRICLNCIEYIELTGICPLCNNSETNSVLLYNTPDYGWDSDRPIIPKKKLAISYFTFILTLDYDPPNR